MEAFSEYKHVYSQPRFWRALSEPSGAHYAYRALMLDLLDPQHAARELRADELGAMRDAVRAKWDLLERGKKRIVVYKQTNVEDLRRVHDMLYEHPEVFGLSPARPRRKFLSRLKKGVLGLCIFSPHLRALIYTCLVYIDVLHYGAPEDDSPARVAECFVDPAHQTAELAATGERFNRLVRVELHREDDVRLQQVRMNIQTLYRVRRLLHALHYDKVVLHGDGATPLLEWAAARTSWVEALADVAAHPSVGALVWHHDLDNIRTVSVTLRLWSPAHQAALERVLASLVLRNPTIGFQNVIRSIFICRAGGGELLPEAAAAKEQARPDEAPEDAPTEADEPAAEPPSEPVAEAAPSGDEAPASRRRKRGRLERHAARISHLVEYQLHEQRRALREAKRLRREVRAQTKLLGRLVGAVASGGLFLSDISSAAQASAGARAAVLPRLDALAAVLPKLDALAAVLPKLDALAAVLPKLDALADQLQAIQRQLQSKDVDPEEGAPAGPVAQEREADLWSYSSRAEIEAPRSVLHADPPVAPAALESSPSRAEATAVYNLRSKRRRDAQ